LCLAFNNNFSTCFNDFSSNGVKTIAYVLCLPCADFNANALYFDICSLSYNLFALMHQLLPLEFANKRAKYIRYRLYAIAAKVIKTGRKVLSNILDDLVFLGAIKPPLIRIL
jgi:hypothetical protein